MTISELKKMLERYDDDSPVICQYSENFNSDLPEEVILVGVSCGTANSENHNCVFNLVGKKM